MSEFLRAIFTTWDLRPVVILVPLVFASLYLRGWLHIRQIEGARGQRRQGGAAAVGRPRLASPWRLASYLSGLGILLLALLSGLDAYASMLFFVHMIQHLLLIMLAPPLLWLGNPYPFILWGLPRPIRLRMSNLLAGPAPFRQALGRATSPGLAWIYLVAAVWLWHDGQLYNLTLLNAVAHDLEHVSFFLAGLVFSWHTVGAMPRLHRTMSYLKRAGYVLAAAAPNMILGVAISFASSPLYTYYETVPRLWGISVMEDQMYGGVIMWVPGSMMYLMIALVLVAQHFRAEEGKAPLPENHWATEESLLAPGVRRGDQRSGVGGRKSEGSRPVTGLVLALALSLAVAAPVAAHGGGTPQLANEPVGPYQVSAWTSPEPAVIGELHVTVSVADMPAGAAVTGLGVQVVATPSEGGAAVTAAATHDNAFLPYFYEADLQLPSSGLWHIAIQVEGAGQTGFDLEVRAAAINVLALALGALLVAGIGGVGWLLLRGGRHPKQRPARRRTAGQMQAKSDQAGSTST